MQSSSVWESLLSSIEKRVNHESFTTWFRPISFISQNQDTICLTVPDPVFEDWIFNNYREVLDESLDENNLAGTKIVFTFDSGASAKPENTAPSLTSLPSLDGNDITPQKPEESKSDRPALTN
ncbi:MAG TPA: DnaA N-terminal domain-containing protein, partial [Blastocatellia bacterium]|nr:DnaA N-terminal domain-containing protein [Blastocatellia bacterium]